MPRPDRFGPCTLIEVGHQKLLVDVGRGATIRLYQLGVPLGSIGVLLLTHYHSDHTVGIPDLWLTGSLQSHFAGRASPLRVIGPSGAKALMSHLERAYALDIRIRLDDEKLPAAGATLDVVEFATEGTVYEKDGLKVIAFEVDHGAAIKPAYGYRFEYGGRVVVISGDTRYCENVVKFGTGADLLIHEVAMVRPDLASQPFVQRIIAHHTSAREAGMVFERAQPKMAAFTHLVFPAVEQISPALLHELIAQTRSTYPGPLVVGKDLTSFDIGETILVRRRVS